MACHLGHLRLSRALRSPHVDWVGWPNSYHKRQAGSDAFFASVEDSIKLHGKLPMGEMDNRTDLTRPEHEICGERPATRADALATIKRDFSRILARGIDGWFLDLRGGWFDDAEIMKLLAACHNIYGKSLCEERASGEIGRASCRERV